MKASKDRMPKGKKLLPKVVVRDSTIVERQMDDLIAACQEPLPELVKYEQLGILALVEDPKAPDKRSKVEQELDARESEIYELRNWIEEVQGQALDLLQNIRMEQATANPIRR